MKQGKSGHSVKSATALGFPISRSKGKGEDTEGKLVPLLAQPLTAVDPVTLSTSLPQHQSAPANQSNCWQDRKESTEREGRAGQD